MAIRKAEFFHAVLATTNWNKEFATLCVWFYVLNYEYDSFKTKQNIFFSVDLPELNIAYVNKK